MLEAKIERIGSSSGVEKRNLEDALNRVGLVIYRKKGALEHPAMIFFVSNVGKYSTVYDSNEALSQFKKLYSELVGCFASVEEREEPLDPKDFENLDYVVIAPKESEVLDQMGEVLQEFFGTESKIPII